ncbi:MAG: carbon starvation protein A [Bacteriovoracaceae bacterium]|jgi:carbon starvation protein|nr:carbon starvation protein A [Bacteriovoracaceae bacterium]
MNSAVLAIFGIMAFLTAYRFYSRYLSEKIFALKSLADTPTPAHALEDGVDYVPCHKNVLTGHHYSSIAGAAPIVGPAVAVIWGWLPAVLWIIFGVIFMGAAHDFGTLVLSMKNGGKSIGQIAEGIFGGESGKRVRTLFLIVIFFLVLMVLAVFALVIANLFISFPGSVLPVNFEIIIAILMGVFINKNGGGKLLWPSILAQICLWVMIYIGTYNPISLEPIFGANQAYAWMIFLMGYSFIACILPVWVLLQPRDYINSHQLYTGLGLIILGLIVVHPPVVAPMINTSADGAPPMFPFLFITIACGAISGFHGLVASGTTSKQVNKWVDARPIGYGSMLGEGLLALLATIAATAGFKTATEWHLHYSSWSAASGLKAKISAFVVGSSRFLGGLGIPEEIGQTVIAVLIISFAATSLDTAARIQRYIIGEIGESFGIDAFKNRFIGAGLAVGSALGLMLLKGGGKGGLILWPLFGATNQMLAGLSLIVIVVYLIKAKKPTASFAIPAVFVVGVTSLSLIMNIKIYIGNSNWFLTTLAITLFISQIWIVVEGLLAIKRFKGAKE